MIANINTKLRAVRCRVLGAGVAVLQRVRTWRRHRGNCLESVPRPSLPDVQGERVFCVNVTKPFTDTTYGASGKEVPSGNDITALAQKICSNPDAAGRQLFTLIRAGENVGAVSHVAGMALAALRCSCRCGMPALPPSLPLLPP